MELTIYSLTQTSAINPMTISVFLLNWLHLTFEAFRAWVHTITTKSPHDHTPNFLLFLHPHPMQSSPCTGVAISILFHQEHGLTDTNGG